MYNECRNAENWAIKALTEYRGWISVKDSLPGKSGTYLIKDKYHVTIAWYRTDQKDWMGLDCVIYADGYISHWMPLPEPPMEGKNGLPGPKNEQQ